MGNKLVAAVLASSADSAVVNTKTDTMRKVREMIDGRSATVQLPPRFASSTGIGHGEGRKALVG